MIKEVCILAGGKSTRMGQDKGLLRLGKQPVIAYIIDTLESLGLAIKIITSNKSYAQFGKVLVTDFFADSGPLGGIHAALSSSDQDRVIVVPCDNPFLPVQILTLLISEASDRGITIINNNETVQPLVGAYSKSLLPKIELSIKQKKLKLITFLNENEVHYLQTQFEEDSFMNINTRENLARALELMVVKEHGFPKKIGRLPA